MASWLRGENSFKMERPFTKSCISLKYPAMQGKYRSVAVIIHQLREFGAMIRFNGRQLAKRLAGFPFRRQCPRAEQVPRGLAHGGNNDHRIQRQVLLDDFDHPVDGYCILD